MTWISRLGAALIKHTITYCSKIYFIRHRQADSLSVRSRCLSFTPMSDRPRCPRPLYLATCHLFATRQHATYRGSGFSFKTTRRNSGDKGLVDHRAYSIFSFLPQMNANELKNTRVRSALGQIDAQGLLVHGLQRPRTQYFADLECTPENTPRGGFILVDFS